MSLLLQAFPIPRGSLVVSCQARADNPLHGPALMAAMAQAAEQGGAAGLRVAGVEDIAAVRAVSALPIIGLIKRFDPKFPVYMTPSLADADAVIAAGADIIAIDATARARDGEPVIEIIKALTHRQHRCVVADVATLAEGLAAARAGARVVATTLSGYTGTSQAPRGTPPDLELVSALVAQCSVPVIAEGRYDTPDLAAEALRRGAHAVVVGTAITNPREITRRFVKGLGTMP